MELTKKLKHLKLNYLKLLRLQHREAIKRMDLQEDQINLVDILQQTQVILIFLLRDHLKGEIINKLLEISISYS